MNMNEIVDQNIGHRPHFSKAAGRICRKKAVYAGHRP